VSPSNNSASPSLRGHGVHGAVTPEVFADTLRFAPQAPRQSDITYRLHSETKPLRSLALSALTLAQRPH